MSVYESIISGEPSLQYWWPLGDSGSSAAELKSSNTGTYQASFTHGGAGLPGSSFSSTILGGGWVKTSANITYTRPVSIEVWVKTTDGNENFLSFESQQTGGFGSFWCVNFGISDGTGLNFLPSNQIGYDCSGGGSGTVNVNTANGTWRHCVLTVSNTTAIVYQDTVPVLTGTGGGNSQGGFWRIGNWNNGAFGDGFFAHAAIYNSILTPSQVLTHYKAGWNLLGSTFSVRDPTASRIPGIN